MRKLLALVLVVCPLASLGAQEAENPAVARAKNSYDALDFPGAIAAARRALQERLSTKDRIAAYEVLAFSYGVLDSSQQARDTFRDLIFLEPDWEPDIERVSPTIASLYREALGRVLVVRRLTVDSAAFVAGDGSVPISFELTRPGRAITRIVGPDFDAVVDSQLVAGPTQIRWRALAPDGGPAAAGSYQVIVTAIEGRNEFSATEPILVAHSPVDTMPHVTSLEGYTELPEMVSPPRDFRPLGIAALYAGLTSAATLALEDRALGGGVRPVIVSVSAGALITGLVMSVRKPDPRPVPANILFNQLLREQVAQQNVEIARQNALRRRQITLTVTPATPGGS